VVKFWAFRAIILVVPILLFLAAFPRFLSGRVLDTAYPVPVYLEMDAILPLRAYEGTARVLSQTAKSDGRTQIARAQAMMLAKAPTAEIIPVLEVGVMQSPASSRGWMLLADLRAADDPVGAGKALALSLDTAPRDVFLAGRRASQAAILWNALDEDARESVRRQVRMLWTESKMRIELLLLLETPEGANLVTQSFVEEPDELRSLNRWVAQQNRRINRERYRRGLR